MSNPTTPQTISMTAQEGLGLVNTLLPILEVAIPGIAGGPVGLGVSAALAITPVVIRLINRLAASGAIDAATQQAQLERVAGVLDFTGDTWSKSVVPIAASPPLAPLP